MHRAEWLVSVIRAHDYRRGAELGVKEGATINRVLCACPRVSMVGIDLWEPTPGYEEWDHSAYKANALNMMDMYPTRLQLIQDCTWDAAAQFPDKSFDFVFVDGDHRTKSVVKDIEAWIPKIRPGGMLAGHDVGWASVREALDETLPQYQVAGHDNCWFVHVE